MKKLLVIAFMFIGLGLSAQSAVKINPLGFLLGSANAGFEYGFSDRFSAEIGASFSSAKATVDGEADVSFTGIGGYAMVR